MGTETESTSPNEPSAKPEEGTFLKAVSLTRHYEYTKTDSLTEHPGPEWRFVHAGTCGYIWERVTHVEAP